MRGRAPLRTLVVQHDEDKPLGLFEQPLRDEGLHLDVRRAGRDDVELRDHAAVVALPGFANPVDETEAVEGTRRTIRAALDAGVPVLGICLGAQLLAQAAGATASRCATEYGFAPVELADEAAADGLLAGLPKRLEVFHAHGYGVTLPPGATALARTASALQAFRVGARSWGFQFHPEPIVAMVDYWVEHFGELMEKNGADPRSVALDVRRLEARSVEFADTVGRRFAHIVREAAAARADG